MKKTHLLALCMFLGMAVPTRAATYEVDSDHSTVMFKVRHLLGKVSGRFDKYKGTFDYDSKNLQMFKASATIDALSINTNTPKRDDHLRSPDFFDVKQFPTLSFVSKGVTDHKGGKGKLKGNLTMHGITKPVVFDIEFIGEAKDPYGNERASVSAMTTVKRADWGLTWNEAIETGGVLVGEDVEIILEIEGVKP